MRRRVPKLWTIKLLEAIELAGGQGPLADAIGVSLQAVGQWKRDGVPALRCRAIEAETGVRAEDLRPDVFVGDSA